MRHTLGTGFSRVAGHRIRLSYLGLCFSNPQFPNSLLSSHQQLPAVECLQFHSQEREGGGGDMLTVDSSELQESLAVTCHVAEAMEGSSQQIGTLESECHLQGPN